MPQNLPERPDFFARHRALLEQAVAATTSRDHWTPYPESPSKSVYGQDAAKAGEAAFHERLGGHFELPGHPASGTTSATETSPYSFPLGVTYPRLTPDEAVAAAQAATGPWRAAGPDARAGAAAEILARLNAVDAGVHLSENLTGGVFVDQSAAFSDFHGNAANPAAGATLSDPAFVTGRFAALQSRRPATAQEHTEESADA
ncbi:hypothetical protein [Streptomyces mirabilis]|uniref:hypothetical protein n=1 Tax=Streptomyces mirabilis TaxID=68239 RepID=UPI0033219FCF